MVDIIYESEFNCENDRYLNVCEINEIENITLNYLEVFKAWKQDSERPQ